ncbi:MAG: rhodanese-like domain-containing protein [Blautia sp.]|uniref:rhodanese-like domain-containing protein n=1 Tax=Blautia sp. TaxID=1955243 RepID=UPI0039920521
MGLFDFFKGSDFNEGIEIYKNTKDAVLLDVRTPEEYLEGRVPGSWNIPLQELKKVERLVDKAVPLFVYCLSGARSRMAAAQLQQMGYASVTNLGGISSYRGKVER